MSDSRKGKLFKKYLARMNVIKKEAFASELFNELKNGKNSYMKIARLESSNFDMTWINMIEDCIHDLGDIIANPREVTKTVTSVIPVELARKTNAESVMHLASHTQYIKEVKENGDIVPNKILNIGSEEDIHTYENRFIATFVRRLVLFINKRYEFVKDFAVLHDEEILYFKNKSIVDGAEVEIETKIKVKTLSDTKNADISNKYVDRILKMREYIMFFYGSKFMKELKTERDVRNPIVMTNILRKNPKYHHCYEVYRFIERYDKLGVSYKIDEDVFDFTEEEMDEINTVLLTNYLALKGKDSRNKIKSTNKEYKPRILSSIDDEQFIYGDLLKGPIEFIRVDEGYQAYLDSLIKTDLPVRPTKIEKEYYQEEYEDKATRKAEKAALDKLNKRKKKEQQEYEKRVKAVIAKREKEEQERLAREAEAARLEEERKIEAVRQALIEDARKGHKEIADDIALSEQEQQVEEPAEQDTSTEPTEEDLAAAREALIADALSEQEEPTSEEQPVEDASEEPQQEEEPVEVIPEEEIQPEETPVEEEPQEVADTPVEPVVEEKPTEVVQEDAQTEEPIEEAPIEIVEEPIEDSESQETIEEPVSEVQPVEEEPQESIEEVPQEVVEEPIQDETMSEEDLEAARAALVSEALNDQQDDVEPVSEEQPQIEDTVNEEELESAREALIADALSEQEEPEPVQEPVEDVQEEPVIEEEEPQEEEPSEVVEESPAEVIEEPVNPQQSTKSTKKVKKPRKTKTKKEKGPTEKIPGRFIVKTIEGYYISQNNFSIHKDEAHIFDDYLEAREIKTQYGGKVVKL